MRWRLQWLVSAAFVSACGSTESGNPEVANPPHATYPPPFGTGSPTSGPVDSAPKPPTEMGAAARQPCELVVTPEIDAGLNDAGKRRALLYRCSVVEGDIACECGIDPQTAEVPSGHFPAAEECRQALFYLCGRALIEARDAGPGAADASDPSR